MKNNQKTKKPPELSFIIPVFNEEKNIKKCLDSIISTNAKKSDYEIITVDNGSTDQSLNIIKNYPFVNLIIASNCNVGKVRNVGAKFAKANYLVFLDGDCEIPSEFVSRALQLIQDNPNSVFGGGILLPENPTWIEKYWTLQSKNKSQLPRKLIGASILIPKSLFFNLNGFKEDITSGEDSDLHKRIRDKKIPILMTNQIDVIHLGNAKDVYSFIRRQAWHSENYLKEIKSSIRDPIFLLVALAAILLVSLPVSALISSKFAYLCIGTLASIPLLLSAKRIYRSQHSQLHLKRLPALYLIDAIYVIGRIFGLLRGIHRLFIGTMKKTKNL